MFTNLICQDSLHEVNIADGNFKKVLILNSSNRDPFSYLIGDAVIILIQSKRRVTVGNILDVLEHKKYSVSWRDADELREVISYLRNGVRDL